MPRPRYKSLAQPDEVRQLPKMHADLVSVGDTTVVRARFEPGWRWSTDLGPIMKTRSCQLHHLGFSVSGTVHVRMDDGEEFDIPPDSIYEMPPGHDAWVVGDEPWVIVEWTSGRAASTALEGPEQRVLATVLFTDIVDSTATLERIGDVAWQDLVDVLHAQPAPLSVAGSDSGSGDRRFESFRPSQLQSRDAREAPRMREGPPSRTLGWSRLDRDGNPPSLGHDVTTLLLGFWRRPRRACAWPNASSQSTETSSRHMSAMPVWSEADPFRVGGCGP